MPDWVLWIIVVLVLCGIAFLARKSAVWRSSDSKADSRTITNRYDGG